MQMVTDTIEGTEDNWQGLAPCCLFFQLPQATVMREKDGSSRKFGFVAIKSTDILHGFVCFSYQSQGSSSFQHPTWLLFLNMSRGRRFVKTVLHVCKKNSLREKPVVRQQSCAAIRFWRTFVYRDLGVTHVQSQPLTKHHPCL